MFDKWLLKREIGKIDRELSRIEFKCSQESDEVTYNYLIERKWDLVEIREGYEKELRGL